MSNFEMSVKNMFQKEQEEGLVRFSLRPSENVHDVAVAGDFNHWKSIPMQRKDNGEFVCELPVSKDPIEYKFIVDGKWIPDPDNPHMTPDSHGSFNSIVPEGQFQL